MTTSYEAGSYYAAVQKFLKRLERKGRSWHTVNHLFRTLHPLGEWLDNPPMREITRECLHKYADELRYKYAPGTLPAVINDIKQFFTWAKKKGLTQKNLGKHLRKPRQRPGRLKAAPEADVFAVIKHLAREIDHLVYRDIFGNLVSEEQEWRYLELKKLHDLCLIVFLYETGARAGEVASLSAREMNRATSRPAAAYTVISWGKTGDRELRFTNATAELWRLWSALRPHNLPFAFYGWNRSAPPRGFTTSGIGQMIERRCRQAGVRPFRSHALRHAKVKRSRQLVGIELASQLAGHSRLSTTWGYANIDDDELDSATIRTGLSIDIWRPDSV